MSIFIEPEKPIEYTSVNELYFGRTKAVQEIIEQIGVVRRAAGVGEHKTWDIRAKYNYKINSSPEMIKLNQLLEKEFGFKVCSCTIYQSATANASTMPISYMVDVALNPKRSIRKMMTVTKTGFRYKPEANYCLLINVSSSLFLDPQLTDAEVAAVMFHEIGHNFSGAMNDNVGNLQIAMITMSVIETIMKVIYDATTGNVEDIIDQATAMTNLVNAANRASVTLDRILAQTVAGRYINQVFDAIRIAGNVVQTTIHDLFSVINILGMPMMILNIFRQLIFIAIPGGIKLLFGKYQDEQLADSFAVMYGLGDELSRSLAKLPNGSQGLILGDTINNSPFIGAWVDICSTPCHMLLSLFDEHPSTAARFKNNIATLQHELDNNKIDPKMRKEITSQIKAMEKSFNELIRDNENISKEKAGYCRRAYEIWLYDHVKGGDPKAGLFKHSKNLDKLDDIAKAKLV